MPLFEVVVIEIATKKDVEENGAVPEKLLLGPIHVIAKDAPTAGQRATLDNADKLRGRQPRPRADAHPPFLVSGPAAEQKKPAPADPRRTPAQAKLLEQLAQAEEKYRPGGLLPMPGIQPWYEPTWIGTGWVNHPTTSGTYTLASSGNTISLLTSSLMKP